ncbi:MAG: CHASE2 domain-containing protein [Mariprofundus sp.]
MSFLASRLSGHLSNISSGLPLTLSTYCHRSTAYFDWLLASLFTIVILTLSLLSPGAGTVDSGTFDTVMKMRWTAPPPSNEIIILDIDEKSLAEMSTKYGNWPWKRDVFAQALAELEFTEAKSIMFTPIISDLDLDHPQSDATLSFVASESFVTVYPLVRLPAYNDQYSKLKVCDLIPAGIMKCRGDQTIAAILPALPGMQHDMAIMNHRLDDDGILRRWSLLWDEGSWRMPTLVGGAIALAHIKPRVELKEPFILNWRDKNHNYQSISFVDYIATLNGESRIDPELFKGKHVIIAASASGLTVQKPSSVGMVNDGELLATALDDAINGTNLKPVSAWQISVVTIIFIWALAALFVYGRSQKNLDGLFVAIQVGAIAVMALTINYTTYFIDLTPLGTFGLGFYSIARLHHMMGNKVFMGAPAYIKFIAATHHFDSVGIIAFKDETKKIMPARFEKLRMQQACASGHIFFCREPFEKNQMFESFNSVRCIVVLAPATAQHDILEDLQKHFKKRGLTEYVIKTFTFPDYIRGNCHMISHYIGLQALYSISQLPISDDKPASKLIASSETTSIAP